MQSLRLKELKLLYFFMSALKKSRRLFVSLFICISTNSLLRLPRLLLPGVSWGGHQSPHKASSSRQPVWHKQNRQGPEHTLHLSGTRYPRAVLPQTLASNRTGQQSHFCKYHLTETPWAKNKSQGLKPITTIYFKCYYTVFPHWNQWQFCCKEKIRCIRKLKNRATPHLMYLCETKGIGAPFRLAWMGWLVERHFYLLFYVVLADFKKKFVYIWFPL